MEWQKGKPEEHDSVFAQYYGTPKWEKGMSRKISNEVLVTVQRYDERLVVTAKVIDGEWKFPTYLLNAKVISWMPFPEPDRS